MQVHEELESLRQKIRDAILGEFPSLEDQLWVSVTTQLCGADDAPTWRVSAIHGLFLFSAGVNRCVQGEGTDPELAVEMLITEVRSAMASAVESVRMVSGLCEVAHV